MDEFLEKIILNYPNQNALEEINATHLESFISELRALQARIENRPFPGGSHGVILYALLGEIRSISAQDEDYEHFSKELPLLYQYFYGRQLLDIYLP